MTGTLHRHTCKVPDPHTLSVCPTRDNAETFCFQAKTAEISVVPLYVHLLDELPTRHALLFSCHLSLYVDSSHEWGGDASVIAPAAPGTVVLPLAVSLDPSCHGAILDLKRCAGAFHPGLCGAGVAACCGAVGGWERER